MTPVRRRVGRVLGLAALLPLVTVAGLDAYNSADASGARTSLTLLVPASPGGGWDTVARELQQAMREHGVVANPQVVNAPGAAGTIGLSRLQQLAGRGDVLMLTGTVMLGGIAVNHSSHDLRATSPIAKVVEDNGALFVPADSPYRDLPGLLTAWQANPGGIAIGGGSLGGTDSLLAASLAKEAGLDPRRMNYLPYSGGGEVLTAVLSHTVDVGIGSYNEFEDQIRAGNVRALALSAPRRQPGVPLPTIAEQGIEVSLPNWQGLVAPPGLAAGQRLELETIVREALATTGWQDALDRNRWVRGEIYGDEFAAFAGEEAVRVTRIVREAGL